MINIHSRLSPRIFEKIWNDPNGILRGPGATDLWKKTWSRNSRVRLPLSNSPAGCIAQAGRLSRLNSGTETPTSALCSSTLYPGFPAHLFLCLLFSFFRSLSQDNHHYTVHANCCPSHWTHAWVIGFGNPYLLAMLILCLLCTVDYM